MDEYPFRYSNPGEFERALAQGEAELDNLTIKYRSMLSGAESYVSARSKNPRWTSTSLAHREAILKRNIINGHARYNRAALELAKCALLLQTDRVELGMVKEARLAAWNEYLKRHAADKIYEGARDFFDKLCWKHRIDSFTLSTLNADETAKVASVIDAIMSERQAS